MSHKIPGKPWKAVAPDIFIINNRNYLHIIDFTKSNLPVVKQVEGFRAYNLNKTCKIIFSEYGLSSKMVSDMGTDFILENFENFCR